MVADTRICSQYALWTYFLLVNSLLIQKIEVSITQKVSTGGNKFFKSFFQIVSADERIAVKSLMPLV